jgi:phenylpyruvate tautomerase PptA (4-oxalocrotonate tautomerase family)
MIDVYVTEGTFANKHTLAQDLANAVMRWAQVPDLALFRDNTAAFIHDLPAEAISNAAGNSDYVRVQVLTPVGVLDRAKQLGVVRELTDIIASAAGDPALTERTWVLITESSEAIGASTDLPTPAPTSPMPHSESSQVTRQQRASSADGASLSGGHKPYDRDYEPSPVPRVRDQALYEAAGGQEGNTLEDRTVVILTTRRSNGRHSDNHRSDVGQGRGTTRSCASRTTAFMLPLHRPQGRPRTRLCTPTSSPTPPSSSRMAATSFIFGRARCSATRNGTGR